MKELSSRTRQPTANGEPAARTFELFVQPGFSEFELASVTQTLQTINEIKGAQLFKWHFVSDKPGLVKGACGVMVRAAPSVPDHAYADWMVVIGSRNPDTKTWLNRARAMRNRGLTAILLSGAATAYIAATNLDDGATTTHWRDAIVLQETGFYPHLSNRFSEKSGNVLTSAGAGSTAELIIGLVSEYLAPHEIVELSNLLLLPAIRTGEAEQPRRIGESTILSDKRLSQVIRRMESTIDTPLSMEELAAELKLSTRKIERMFKTAFEMSPAQFYRRLRLKRARVLLKETHLSLVEIASATGFQSRNTFSTRFRREFGVLPSEMRSAMKTRYFVHS